MILLFSFLWGLALFLGAEEALAELPDYTPLVNLPGIQEGSTSIPAFINRVYIFTIVIGALLGVVKIALAGAKYSMGDVITNKEEAKKDIMGVLLGLVVLLAPWIVLNTIYPGLLNLDFTKNITNVGGVGEPSSGEVVVGCNELGTTEEDCRVICEESGGVLNSDGSCVYGEIKPREYVENEVQNTFGCYETSGLIKTNLSNEECRFVCDTWAMGLEGYISHTVTITTIPDMMNDALELKYCHVIAKVEL